MSIPVCRWCTHMQQIWGIGVKDRYYCKIAKNIKTNNFIAYGIRGLFDRYPAIRTSPRWCPLRIEKDRDNK